MSSANNNCGACGKVVYPMEKVSVEGVSYHKPCLRCQHCNNVLTLGKFAALNGKFYCKPHFKQLFALKGNYSDGFNNGTTVTERYLMINTTGDEAISAPASAAPSRKNTEARPISSLDLDEKMATVPEVQN